MISNRLSNTIIPLLPCIHEYRKFGLNIKFIKLTVETLFNIFNRDQRPAVAVHRIGIQEEEEEECSIYLKVTPAVICRLLQASGGPCRRLMTV